MVTGKEVHTQKIDFLRLFGKKVVLNVSRWAWRMRKRVIYRKKPIFLKLAHWSKANVVQSKIALGVFFLLLVSILIFWD